ncbi:MAG TPA: bifunctional oligoribonuclease/PAP phosphatase NrnA [Candidatus Woesebacteria bacterium]|nr:bifunctional oligoribonuclease/PAP phosphatase NrnA [Candidatus Woesebacteria bacterium]
MFNKLISKKIWREIKKSQNILLTFHPSPDADSVGSNLALYQVLSKMGKNVTILAGDSEYPKNLKSLPGSNKVLSKNFFQIDQNNYDLFIIVDISDKKQISRQGNVVISKKLKTIIIDHHPTNSKFANINLVDDKAPAACQVLYNIFKTNKVKITKNIAACLFIGLYADTGGFKYFNTNYKTYLIASELTKIYPNFNKLIFDLENSDQPDRLKFLSLILGSIDTFLSEKVAIASIDFETIKNNNISNDVINGSDIANTIKSVVGWEIGISLIEVQPNLIKVSFRTRDPEKYNLTKISVALGGGGHQSAAGATLNNMSLTQAKELIVAKICQVYPKIGNI